MRANEATAPRLRLRKKRFDQAADEVFGSKLTDRKVAARLGVDPSVLSLYRNGHRQPPTAFITQVLAAFPNYKFEDLFEPATEPERDAS